MFAKFRFCTSKPIAIEFGGFLFTKLRCFQHRATNLQKLEIYTARLNYAFLAEIVVKFCPNLELLALSNVDGLSFKKLTLSLYSNLHTCGVKNDKKSLIVDVGTSTNFYLDEVNQLTNVEMCGLIVQKSGHKNIRIERSCDS
uniref:Uncharacterized protein n=1 Tax=Romanomermis culicivorax TaxID=13658 RepID=A0A915HSS2_ROMCU